MARKLARKSKNTFIIICFCLAAVAGLLFGGYQVFRQVKNSPIWYLGKINLVLVGEKSISVFSLEGKDSRLTKLPFPKKIVLPRGFGEYELGKIYRLGELEKRGGQLILETFRSSLNIPVAGYLYQDTFSASNFNSPANFIGMVSLAVKKKIKTNLSLVELLTLYFRGKRLSLSLFKESEYKEDGLSEIFKDKQVRQEALAVEILNGTQHPMLAQKAGTFWENLGGWVIRVGDYDKQLASSLLITRGELRECYSSKVLINFFKPELVWMDENESRADMTLILGEDYWKSVAEKW